MVEELEVLKSIVGDLTNMGVWAIIAYIGYAFGKIILTLWAVLWFLMKIASKLFEHLKADITRAEATQIKEEAERIKREAISDTEDMARKVDNYKHMYQIMKEKQNGEQSSELGATTSPAAE